MTELYPLACDPGGIPAEARAAHFELVSRLFTAQAIERQPVEGGRAFRFPVEALSELGTFIENERRCCPFLTFRLTLAPAAGLWLELTGPEGTPEFLDHELPTEVDA
jgi:hypothetical protein